MIKMGGGIFLIQIKISVEIMKGSLDESLGKYDAFYVMCLSILIYANMYNLYMLSIICCVLSISMLI